MGMTSTTTTSSSSSGQERGGAHILLLPLPAQGHTNPMLQFGRRLAYHGLRPTLVTTRYVLSTAPPPGEPFRVASISDGCDEGGWASCPDPVEYCHQLETMGSQTPRPAAVLVYDPHVSWARRGAPAAGVPTAAFLSQPCVVDLIYGEVWAGRVPVPMNDGSH